MPEDDMKLPPGKTCNDCQWFGRCAWLISCKPTNVFCDWSPSKFREKIRVEAEAKEQQ